MTQKVRVPPGPGDYERGGMYEAWQRKNRVHNSPGNNQFQQFKYKKLLQMENPSFLKQNSSSCLAGNLEIM